MTAVRKLRVLIVAVSGVAALLVVVSRWASRTMSDDRRAERNGTMGAGAAAGSAPDLSFYETLGTGRPGTGAGIDGPAAGRLTAPDPVSPGQGAFVVQVLATRDAAQARRLRDRLAARGLPAVLSEGRAGRQATYLVRVGRYADRRGAEAVLRKLRGEKGLTPWILREHE